MHNRSALATALLALVLGSNLPAEDSVATDDRALQAIDKAIPLLERGMAGAADERKCFTCHNQAVPVFALAEARRRGFTVDAENFQRQLDHTAAHLKRGRKDYLRGKGQGGRVLTAGYALWTLEAGDRTGDETTAAVASFLLDYQSEANHWRHPGSRPPSSGSDFTATYLALRGLIDYGTDEQQQQISSRIDEVATWILSTQPKDTEDRVFKLLSLPYLDVDEQEISAAVKELIDLQRDDGGWAQLDEMSSDAYATATALFALLDAGEVSSDHPAVQRGIEYLLGSQLDDGSWRVETRADPIQKYFESGFPHGEDQFISIAASGWATLALLLGTPETR